MGGIAAGNANSYLPYFIIPILLCCYIAIRQSFILDRQFNDFLKGRPEMKQGYIFSGTGGMTTEKFNSDHIPAISTNDGQNDATSNNKPTFHTGSFANCTDLIEEGTSIDGPNSGTVVVSCKKIRFQAELKSFHNNIGIITGVLSSAGGKGPKRRKSIRRTWASNRNAVFFLVAGPWENIADEYEKHGDLIWIDEEEVYNGEQSVLTLKTYSFFAISHAAMKKFDFSYHHVFKTDDDSYLSLDTLHHELKVKDLGFTKDRRNTHDYFGQCQLKYPKVHREEEYKWPIQKETYPEPWFPRYCQGSGFGLSKKFLDCAVTENHIANVRFMPFEDVAVGMLAERCGIFTEWPSTAKVKVFRFHSDEMKKRVRLDVKKRDDVLPPAACMTNKIVQHRIIDEADMEEHHKSVLDKGYCNVTRDARDKKIKELDEQGIEWVG